MDCGDMKKTRKIHTCFTTYAISARVTAVKPQEWAKPELGTVSLFRYAGGKRMKRATYIEISNCDEVAVESDLDERRVQEKTFL
jgi:hypothetical protein